MSTATTVNVDIRRRVGRAWREIRRGAAMVRVKDLFYTQGGEPLDIALADALSLICQQGPLRMGELADAMHITPASTTRAVGCLVDKGFVERVRAEDDQRSIVVNATMAGRERYGEISSRVQQGLSEILSEFTPEEQLLLAEYLERFVTAVDKLAQSADER
ncbi:MAG: MarR family winged helix-turn-helix transcriptional regulator [Acidimicrobiales bacterium]